MRQSDRVKELILMREIEISGQVIEETTRWSRCLADHLLAVGTASLLS